MTGILFADGFEEIEAITTLDLLRRAGIETISIGVNGKKVKGVHDILVEADTILSELKEVPENIIIPGGMPGAENISLSDKACATIETVFDRGGLVAAICAAPAVVLGSLGILKGRKAVCYPGYEKKFKHAEYIDKNVVCDGNIITARAAGVTIEFALEIISFLDCKEKSRMIADRLCI